MSFENEQYVSSRMDRIEALEQEIARLKQQLEEAYIILSATSETMNASEWQHRKDQFLTKYRGKNG